MFWRGVVIWPSAKIEGISSLFYYLRISASGGTRGLCKGPISGLLRRGIGVAGRHGPPKGLENIVILCFESRFSKQNSVIGLKSNILPPKISGLATPSAWFTCRLYRLKARASRSKVSPTVVHIESMAGIWSFRLNFVKKFCLNYYSRNLVLFNFRRDNARVFQRVSMNLNMTVGQAACQLLCRYRPTQSTLAASCVC